MIVLVTFSCVDVVNDLLAFYLLLSPSPRNIPESKMRLQPFEVSLAKDRATILTAYSRLCDASPRSTPLYSSAWRRYRLVSILLQPLLAICSSPISLLRAAAPQQLKASSHFALQSLRFESPGAVVFVVRFMPLYSMCYSNLAQAHWTTLNWYGMVAKRQSLQI